MAETLECRSTRFRFSILHMIGLMSVVGVMAAFPRFVFGVVMFVSFCVPVTGPLLAVLVFRIVRYFTALSDRSKSRPSVLGWIAVVASMVAVAWCLFVRDRWHLNAFDESFPRPWPYPDEWLIEVQRWWDRLNPPSPGTLKIHGEYFVVLSGINLVSLTAFAVLGVVCGFVFRGVDINAILRRMLNWNWIRSDSKQD